MQYISVLIKLNIKNNLGDTHKNVDYKIWKSGGPVVIFSPIWFKMIRYQAKKLSILSLVFIFNEFKPSIWLCISTDTCSPFKKYNKQKFDVN